MVIVDWIVRHVQAKPWAVYRARYGVHYRNRLRSFKVKRGLPKIFDPSSKML